MTGLLYSWMLIHLSVQTLQNVAHGKLIQHTAVLQDYPG